MPAMRLAFAAMSAGTPDMNADIQRRARDAAATVLARCREMGFARAGITPALPSARGEELRAWLAAGKQGAMAWLADDLDTRLDPRRLLDGAQSIVMVADVYAHGNEPEDVPAGHGRIARYARSEDYHQIVRRRLHALSDEMRVRFPGSQWRTVVDIVPFAEREHAQRAGLGWAAKNTMLIHPELGSWFVLGGVITTLELTPPEDQTPVSDACGTCTRCIDACPTGAIEPWSVDAARCISALTIERRDAIEPELREGIGDWLFGCDICQDVCPHNRVRSEGQVPPVNEAYAPRVRTLDVLGVLGWTAADRASVLTKTALKRATLVMWKRNAAVVASNLLRAHERGEGNMPPDHASALRARLAQIAADPSEDPMVREAAGGASPPAINPPHLGD